MSQQGFVQRYDWQTGNNYIVRPTHPDPEVKLRFNWNAAINIDPFDTSTIYFGSQFIHKSTDKGLTWEVISKDLTTNDPDKQKQSESGGLTMDATGAENHCTILVIEPSPIEQNMIWAATDDGKVHYTQNGGNDWIDVSDNIKGLPKGSWITQIKASNKNKGEALLVANDYRRFNYEPYAFRTTNYGKTWQRIVSQKDVKSYALSIIEDPIEKNLLFLGTDDGLYISMNAGVNWIKWTKGFPTVSVKDLVIHPREHDLIIGTFGRAAWVLDDIRPLRSIAQNNQILNKKLQIFEPPVAYQAAYQQPSGTRFGADAIFNGENKKYGALLSYYIQVDPKLKEEKKPEEGKEDIEDEKDANKTKWDSIKIKIFDGDRLIRTLKQKAPDSTGIYKTVWQMSEKGVSSPSRTLKKEDQEPQGIMVKPGTYKVELSYGDLISETKVSVKSDPRLTVSQKNIDEVYTAGKTLEKMMEVSTEAVKKLVQSKDITSKYQKELQALDKDTYKDEIKLSKEVAKKIDTVIALYIGKEDKRQGITRNPEINILERLNTARYYVSSRQNGITETENTLIKNAKAALQKGIETTNTFFYTTWAEYQKKIEALKTSPFKKVEKFSLE